eukprot:TRINITY_DN8132_c0_g1_i1.p1 TRINITY_DN8132_c0_g1~~TRINITY_DN8132_c0_g1_i1.p1  ORF type:complete len:175 (-),score=43.80 TRINITY_DN8132_c0_g1_i1:243-767(-)
MTQQFWRSKTFHEPLLEPGSMETLTVAATRQGLVSSMPSEADLEMSPTGGPSPTGTATSGTPDRRALAHAAMVHEARQEHLSAMGQPLTLSSVVPESSFALSPSDCQEDFPYRDRVMKHYRNNYASFSTSSPSASGSYEPPAAEHEAADKTPHSPNPAAPLSRGAAPDMDPVHI